MNNSKSSKWSISWIEMVYILTSRRNKDQLVGRIFVTPGLYWKIYKSSSFILDLELTYVNFINYRPHIYARNGKGEDQNWLLGMSNETTCIKKYQNMNNLIVLLID